MLIDEVRRNSHAPSITSPIRDNPRSSLETPMIRLCAPDELPEAQSRGFCVEDLQLFAVRKGGEVFVYRNRCPHRGVPLQWQADQFLDPSASLIQCARHGALFLIESGECVAGPCEGEALRAIDCREDGEGIWVDL